MRSALFAAALLFGTAAIAQDYGTVPSTTAPPVDATTTTPPPFDATTTTTTTTMTTQVPAGAVVAPSNANPELDARGIPVISAPAVAPPGFNQPAGMNGVGGPMVDPSAAPAPQPATQSYPPCSRTVTDHCVQTYERGRSPQ